MKYELKIKLIYEYDSDTMQKKKEYHFEDYIFNASSMKITLRDDFTIIISDVICKNYDDAIIKVEQVLPDICKTLTLIMQIESGENEKYQPNVSYNISSLKIISSEDTSDSVIVDEKDGVKTLYLSEQIEFHDSLSIKALHTLSFEYFPVLFQHTDGVAVDFFKDSLYRAIRCRDIQSKFFTLFTMIEYIEAKKTSEIQTSSLFNDRKAETIVSFLSSLDYKDEDTKKRSVSRLSDVIKNATIETRSEKLCHVLWHCYGIKCISKSLVRYDIEPKKLNDFIKTRNSLFHGNSLNVEELNEKIQLTNELLFLCLEILKKEAIV